jgi:hypothetical protein
LIDSKRGFTSDTHSALNTKLCEKAIRQRIINPVTCPPQKLAVSYRPENSDNDSESTESKRGNSAKVKKPTKGKLAKKTAVVSSSDEKTEDANKESTTAVTDKPTVADNIVTENTVTENTITDNIVTNTTTVTDIPSDPVQESDKKRLRTIEIIVCLQKMIADEMELSDESLSIIEKVIKA